MTDHPITPPPELVHQWANHSASVHRENGTYEQHEFAIATQAARWGADQELEACVEWLGDAPVVWDNNGDLHPGSYLRDARRPKPSLKKQALEAMHRNWNPHNNDDFDTIRRALESIND
jgi:hypothetical protein